MDYVKKLEETKQGVGMIVEALPDHMTSFMAMRTTALVDTTLTAKTKELIALSIGIAQKCEPCIMMHTESLVSLGATRAEIEDAVSVCMFMAGGPALAYGSKALECFDQLLEASKQE